MEKLKHAFQEVLTATLPVVILIIILNFTVARFSTELMVNFLSGALMMMLGMALFLFGADISMMKVGSLAGSFLVKKGSIIYIIVIGFIVGTVVTLAEPDVQVLANQVTTVSGGEVSKMVLMLSVGTGVGIFLVLALLRIIFQKKLLTILLIGYAIVFILGALTSKNFMPVAFDSGGVTTGPMTVPFILSLGSGVTAVSRSKDGEDDSFGMVGLASLGPIIAVMILGVVFK